MHKPTTNIMKKLKPFMTLLMIIALISGTMAQTSREYSVDEKELLEADLAAEAYDVYVLTTSGGVYDLEHYITITANTVIKAAEGLAEKPVIMRSNNTGIGAGVFRIADETVNIGLERLIFDGTVTGDVKIVGFRAESTAHFDVENCVFRNFTQHNGVFRLQGPESTIDVRNSVFHDITQRVIHYYTPTIEYGHVNIDNCVFYNINGSVVFARTASAEGGPTIPSSLTINHSTFHNISPGNDGVIRGRNTATGETLITNSVFTNISGPLTVNQPSVTVDYCYVGSLTPIPEGTNLFSITPVYEAPEDQNFRILNAEYFLVSTGEIAGATFYYPPRVNPDLLIEDGTHVRLSYSRPMEITSAENVENYALSGTYGLTGNPYSAELVNEREVLLNVGDITDVPEGETIVITVTDVTDLNGVAVEDNNVAVFQIVDLEVFLEPQTVNNGAGQTVAVQSSFSSGYVYIVLEHVPQATKDDLDVAVDAAQAAFAVVTSSNTNMNISTFNLTPGVYNAYSVSADGELSAPCANTVTVLNVLDVIAGPIRTEIMHNTMDRRIGYPAIIAPGGEYPSLKVIAQETGTVEVKVVLLETGAVVQQLEPLNMINGEEETFTFTGTPDEGRYTILISMVNNEEPIVQDAFYFTVMDVDQLPDNYSIVVHRGEDDKLVYIPDHRGNRIPDFSYVGYRGAEDTPAPIPDLPVRVELEPKEGDDTERIQEAIDEVSSLPLDADGFRGAVLLKKGIYEIGGILNINASGVVLRGKGQGDFKDFWLDPALDMTLVELKESLEGTEATVLIATGQERRFLIRVEGTGGVVLDLSTETEIFDNYVPVGANSFTVNSAENYHVGDRIIVERSGNEHWISYIKMDQIPPDGGTITQWPPFSLQYEYVITAIEGNLITINSSIVNAIEKRWGGGRIYKYSDPERISHSGVENLRAISFWRINEDGVDDTRHADKFLLLDNIRDGWARNLTAEHFYENAAFMMGRNSLAITIKNSSSLIAPREFYAGPGYDPSGRTFYETGVYTGRYGFHFTGQHGLVKDCYAVNNRHAFVVNSRVTGPNVFVNCEGENSLTWSEPHHRWSTGGLYDNVKDDIALMNRLRFGSGHGWAGANYVAWNTEGPLVCEKPPTAQNWSIGHTGQLVFGPFHDWNMTNYGFSLGYWEKRFVTVSPYSLYYKQLEDRTGVMVSAPTVWKPAMEWGNIEFFPNPSTGRGNIRFTQPKEGWCEISIYDLSGRRAGQSEKKFFLAGTHEQAWDFGSLPNGIYVFKLRTNSGVITTKGILTR